MLQFSGAIWYPMVYELPQAAKTAFGKQKRDRQFDRTWRYIDDLKASHVFPIAGPPCFLDDELWQFNDIFGDEGNIFPDQSRVHAPSTPRSAAPTASCCCPGSVADAHRRTAATTTHPVADVDEFFANKEQHLEEYARAPAAGHRGGEGVLAAPRDRRAQGDEAADRAAAGRVDLPGQGRRRPGPLRPGRLRRRDRSSRSWWTSRARRCGRTPTRRSATASAPSGRWSSTCCTSTRCDWVNSLFLSCRFSAARIGQYNEFVYAFFKCLSEERLQYAEGWYDEHERSTDAEDITLGDWVVQRRCPHLKADLTRFGIVDGDTLTCQLHGWKFDLPSGRCLTSVGHKIRAHRADEEPRARRRPDPAAALQPRRHGAAVAPQSTRPEVGITGP